MSIKKGYKVIAGAPIEPVWGTISGDITDQADLQAALAEKVGANSPAFIGTPTAPTPPVGSYDDRIATTSYVQQAIESVDGLPSQTGHNGQFLTTNGSSASWATVDVLPSQSGQSGKFLTTNGTTASWSDLTGVVKLNGGGTQQTIQLTSGSGTTPLGVKSMSTGSYISFSGTGGWLGSYGVTSTKQPTFYNGTSYTLAFKDELGDITSLTTITKTSAVAAINELNSNALKTKTVIQNMNTHGRVDRLWFSEIHDVLYKADRRFTITGTGFTTFDETRLFNGSFEDYNTKLEAGNTGVIEISGSSITGIYRSGYIFVSFYSSWSPHTADQVAITIENTGGNVATLTPEAWETKGSGASSYVTVVRAEVPSLSTANAISKITITITNSGSGDICPTEIEYFLSRPSSIELIPAVTKYGNNTIYGNLTVDSIIKSGGTASQFLKANGTVDSTAYAPLASPALTGTPTTPTATAGTNTTQIATTEFVQTAINSIDALPTQAGNNGKFLTTDGTNASWATVDVLPSQSGQSGKFLTTNGTSASWTNITADSEVEWATQGTTTYQQIKDWSDDNKIVKVKYQNVIYTLTALTSTSSTLKAYFNSSDEKNDQLKCLEVQAPISNPDSGIWFSTAHYIQDRIPAGTSGNIVTYTGTAGSVGSATINDIVPSQSGNSGKVLTTNGTAVSWATADGLPDQTGQSGKFLTTNGTTASWAESSGSTITYWYDD